MREDSRIAMGLLAKCGAVIKNSHIVYTAGDHGEAYVNKDGIYVDPFLTSIICSEMAIRIHEFMQENKEKRGIAIVSPAVGGVALSQWTTHHLKLLGYDAVALYADKETVKGADGKDQEVFVLKRGYDELVAGRVVIVVEDVLNTGGSAAKTVKAVRDKSSDVQMVVAVCNRGGVTRETLGVNHLEALINVNLARYPAADCPLCRKQVPINTSVGHGREFLKQHPEYPR